MASKLPDPFDRDNLTLGGLKQPKITTGVHNLGWVEVDSAPPGFAENPAPLPNSRGNEKFYSYDGSWKSGQLHGYGTYQYDDNFTYTGEWEMNKPTGDGEAVYKSDSAYQGEWRLGKPEGFGEQVRLSII